MSTNKRLTRAMTGLLLLTVMLSGCARSIDRHPRQIHSVTFTKSDRSSHDPFPEPIRTDDSWHMESATSPVRKYDAFPTAHGPVLITRNEDKQIISLDANTGSVNWRLTMSTGIGAEKRAANTPQTWASTQEAVVSPHGKYLALRTHSYLNPEDSENIEAYSQTACQPAKPLVRAHLRKAVNKAHWRPARGHHRPGHQNRGHDSHRRDLRHGSGAGPHQ